MHKRHFVYRMVCSSQERNIKTTMKEINDINKGQSISNKYILNDTIKDVLFYNDILKNPLEKSIFISCKKIEKVVSALHLVTDVMDRTLPLTQSLQRGSIELLDAGYQLVTGQQTINPGMVTKVLVRLEQVQSLIAVGKVAHYISDMNARVLSTELDKVVTLLVKDVQELNKKYLSYEYSRTPESIIDQPVLSHTLLDESRFDALGKSEKTVTVSRRFINDTKTTSKISINDNNGNSFNEKDNLINLNTIKTTYPMNLQIKDRKQSILDVVRSHKNASMQDIQKFVTDCSEKTLQREMVALIAAGMIRKVGDKRWATYHIA